MNKHGTPYKTTTTEFSSYVYTIEFHYNYFALHETQLLLYNYHSRY
jgi:hypothetical protein